MYAVDDVRAWIHAHPAVPVTIERYVIPSETVAGFGGPGGHTSSVFDQLDEQPGLQPEDDGQAADTDA